MRASGGKTPGGGGRTPGGGKLWNRMTTNKSPDNQFKDRVDSARVRQDNKEKLE